jgi:hypothetical protein
MKSLFRNFHRTRYFIVASFITCILGLSVSFFPLSSFFYNHLSISPFQFGLALKIEATIMVIYLTVLCSISIYGLHKSQKRNNREYQLGFKFAITFILIAVAAFLTFFFLIFPPPLYLD